MIQVYGIKNCDTVKKALAWFKNHQIDFEFHDFKKEAVSLEKLTSWAEKLGWETLLNKRGTTWKKLVPQEQNLIDNLPSALELMQKKSSIIKRPVIEFNDSVLLGFDELKYTSNFM